MEEGGLAGPQHGWWEMSPAFALGSSQPDGGCWSRSINTLGQPSVRTARVGGQALAGENPGDTEADPEKYAVSPRSRFLSQLCP